MKASEHFDLPVEAGRANCNGDDLFGAGGNGIWHATFCSQEQAQIAARCINHADKLAEALAVMLVEHSKHQLPTKASLAAAITLEAYRSAE